MQNPFEQGYWEEGALVTFGFRSVGKNVRIAKNCTIVGLNNISFGDGVRIDGNTLIVASSGHVTIGSYVHIGGACSLGGGGGITLEDFSGLSQGVKIYSVSDDYSGESLTNPCVPINYKKVQSSPVSIGRHVIVGSGSVILPGVTIGEGSSVGALSLVNRSLDAWGVYFGAPAKRLKSRAKNLLLLETEFLSSLR
jgi:acetyltransferase-like isoleucine patch superfamily enzyme